MAPKQSTPSKMPPFVSSSSSEEENESEEEEELPETDSEEEVVLKRPGREDEEEDDDEEGDKEEEEEVPKKPSGEDEEEEEEDFVVAQKSEKIIQKPLPSLSSKLTLTKSQEENKSETESDSELEVPKAKRFKKIEDSVDVTKKSSNDVKKTPFQRVWSEDDELAVLKGMINYVEKNGVNAIKCMASFHDYIKVYLQIDVSLSQLKDKMFRLKKKFENNRKGKMGKEKIFNKIHDQTIFDLSKRIWGSEVEGATIGDSSVKFNGKVKTRQQSNAGGNSSSLKVESPYFGMSDAYVLRKGSELMHGGKKDEMDEKLRQLHVEELKLFLKRNELVREYTNVVLAAYQNKMDED